MNSHPRLIICPVIVFLICTLASQAQQIKGKSDRLRNAPSLFNARIRNVPAFLHGSKFRTQRSIKSRENTLVSPLLDGTFGINGTTIAFIGNRDSTYAIGQASALQQDGKIVVAGYSSIASSYAFTVVRYAPTGTVDSAFGTDGIVRTFFAGGAGIDKARSVVVQPDGKIVAAGVSPIGGQGASFALARYTTDGMPDSTFGTNGTVRAQVLGAPGGNDDAASVALQPDGKMVVAGTSNSGFGVMRFNANGAIDSTFGNHGGVATTIRGGDGVEDHGRSVALQADGKIVVTGSSYSFLGGGNAFAVARFDTDGTIDTTFGGYGTIRVPVAGYGPDAMGYSVAVGPNGKIVLAGYFYNGGYRFGLYRYKNNGTLDSTFGSNGIVSNGISGGNAGDDRGASVSLRPDGRIVVAGSSSNGSGYAFAAAQYDTNGAPDTTFGTSGTLRMAISGGNGTLDQAASVSLAPGGRIVLAGSSSGNSGSAFALARIDSNGSRDNTFGVNGTVRTELTGIFGSANGRSVAIQGDGKIVVAGISYTSMVITSFAVARFNANGTLDNTFNTNGIATTLIAGGVGRDVGLSAAIQSDGKIVVAGVSTGATTTAIGVVRYNTNGTLDNSFGTGGTVRTPLDGGTLSTPANSVALQPDGKILVAGSLENGSSSSFVLTRYTRNGALDTRFGTNGSVTTFIAGGSGQDYAEAVAIQADGKMVAAGVSASGSNNSFAVARYDTSGTLDNSFGTNGTLRTAISGSDGTYDSGSSLAMQADGKIVVAGTCLVSAGSQFAVARYNPSGALDNGFGSNGTARTSINGSIGTYDVGQSVAIQSDGRILVGGTSEDSANAGFAIARFTPAGGPDETFSPGGSVRIQIYGGLGEDVVGAIVVQPNGKIVEAGCSVFYAYPAFCLARFLPGIVPFASAVSAESILDSSATLHGIVYPSRATGTARLVYGKAPATYTDSVSASPTLYNGDTTTAISASLSGLSGRTTYYYRVSAVNTSPAANYASDERSFTTLDPVPVPPTGISPHGNANVARKATFVWHASPFATTYRLQIGTDTVFSSVVFDTSLSDTTKILANPLAATTQYTWRVRALDAAGTSGYSSALTFTTGTLLGIAEPKGVPKEFALLQNFPNPFNPTTTIRFALPKETRVQLVVYNVLGERVITLVDEVRPAGNYEERLDAKSVASGVFFLRMQAGDFVQIRRMMVLK